MALIEQLATSATLGGSFARLPAPNRRRPRRCEPVTYRVRIDLQFTKPPVWRRLELASDLYLDELHEIIQAAFTWYDGHLHQFGSGPEYYSDATEYYLCPYQVAEGDPGIAEEQVRLDEVLVEVGDRLFYCYDFGDDWQHTVKLEKVGPRIESSSRAVCTTGRRPAPAEDSGGLDFELLVPATDPTHPDHSRALAEFRERFGTDIDARDWAPTPFDIDELNRILAGFGHGSSARPETPGLVTAPQPLADLLARVPAAAAKQRLRELITRAGLDEPRHLDYDTAAAVVRPYTRLLDHIGDDGVTLTAAGYLPPALVQALFTDLGIGERWIGKGNREDMTPDVLALRESAQRMGLLRKHSGRLLPTARGRRLRTDPIPLWEHLAGRLPGLVSHDADRDACRLYLLALAAAATQSLGQTVAEHLTALGWATPDGSPITAAMVPARIEPIEDVLRILNLVRPWSDRGDPTTPGAAGFARAVLAEWG